VICVDPGSYKFSLQVSKVYRVLEPIKGDPDSWLRIVDESGEDYLYPGKYFRPIALAEDVERAIAAHSTQS